MSADYYGRALEHDRHMQAMANADALGPIVTVAPGEVRLEVPAAMAATIRGTATLYRAADASADRTMTLAPATGSTIAIPTIGLASGHWRLQVQWSAAGRDYYLERHLQLP